LFSGALIVWAVMVRGSGVWIEDFISFWCDAFYKSFLNSAYSVLLKNLCELGFTKALHLPKSLDSSHLILEIKGELMLQTTTLIQQQWGNSHFTSLSPPCF